MTTPAPNDDGVLRIRGRSGAGCFGWALPLAVPATGALLAGSVVVFVGSAADGKIPWIDASAVRQIPAQTVLVLVPVLFGAGCLIAIALAGRVAEAFGAVEIRGRGVLFRGTVAGDYEIPWGEIACFDDRRPDVVKLVARPQTRGALLDLAIPTVREEDRVAVLDFLARKGIARRE